MTSEKVTHKDTSADPGGHATSTADEERPLEAWARCAPIRLAGYEDDLTETHILRGID